MTRLAVRFLSAVWLAAQFAGGALADEGRRCRDDAMLVLDSSGSMAGTDMNSLTPHVTKVREALAAVVPEIAPMRNLGLIVYGPGSEAKCENIDMRLPLLPTARRPFLAR